MGDGSERVLMGRISGLYGVRGWVKVYSHTQPRENILQYSPWLIKLNGQWREMTVAGGRAHGKGVVAHLAGCDDRDVAATMLGADIAIRRDQLPETVPGEYYWADLIGLQVINREGVELGNVDSLMETGSNDVLVVKGERERLIPYLYGDVVEEVDLEQGVMRVDWDPEF